MPVAKNINLTALSTALLSLTFATTTMADDFNKSIEKALKFGQDDAKYGQVKFDLRFRYDNTDTSNLAKHTANAFTGRLRLGYLTPVFQGLQGYAEFEGNQDIVANNYNSTENGKTQYETIADPQRNELNQLWLSYKGVPDTEFKVGRQRIQIDNERFIGAAAWRQLERTFDGLLITNNSLPNTTVKVGYIVKEQNTDSTIHKMQLPIANVAYKFEGYGTLSSYGYFFDDHDLRPQDSNQTYGVRFDGTRKMTDEVSLLYTAEYAHQRNYASNPVAYQVDYYHLIGGVTAFGVTAKAGMEQLGGKGYNKTFDTPLGLLHKFNGWADVFTTTPDNGLRDIYATLETEVVGTKLIGTYHTFNDDASRQYYGDEWNFMVSKEFFKHYTLMAKYAYFNANASGTKIVSGTSPIYLYDTQKVWFGVNIIF